MKRFLTIIGLIFIIACSGTVVADAALKIGVVNFQKALNSVDEGKEAKKNLESEFKKKQKQLDIQQKELEAMRQELQEQAMVLPQDKLKAKQEDFQNKFLEFRKKAAEFQQEMVQREAELSTKILGRLKTIVEDIGKKEDYTLILEESGDPVLYVESKDDLTDRVIKAYNKKY